VCTEDASGRAVLDIAGGLATLATGAKAAPFVYFGTAGDKGSVVGVGVITVVVSGVLLYATVRNFRVTRACRREWERYRRWLVVGRPAYLERERAAAERERAAAEREARARKECKSVIVGFRQAEDPVRKSEIWHAMPDECRQVFAADRRSAE
jgi:hypothetical protein